MLIRQAVLEQWVKFKDGAVDPAAAAITTNTAIDLVRSLEKQARPVIESYTKSLNSKDTQLPVYWYSLGSWIKDIDDKTCGTNIYAPLLGADIDCQAYQSADFNSRDNTCVEGEYIGDWILESRSFRWAYKLIQLYCMEFFSKTNATFKVPPGHEPIRSGSGGRPDDAKLFEQIRTCHGQDIQWLYELSFLANYGFGPVFPCLDEVSRGFRISKHFPLTRVVVPLTIPQQYAGVHLMHLEAVPPIPLPLLFARDALFGVLIANSRLTSA